jgi:hypothetical protein
MLPPRVRSFTPLPTLQPPGPPGELPLGHDGVVRRARQRAVSGAAHGRREASVADIQRRVAHVPRNQTRDGIALSPIRARVADRRHAAAPGERQERRDPVHVRRGSGCRKQGQRTESETARKRSRFINSPPGSAAKRYEGTDGSKFFFNFGTCEESD